MLAAIFGVTLAAVLALSVTLAVVGAQIAHAHEHARWSAEALALHLQLGVDAGRYMKEVHELSVPSSTTERQLAEAGLRVERDLAAIAGLLRSSHESEGHDHGLDLRAEEDSRLERLRDTFADIARRVVAMHGARAAGGALDEGSLAELEHISEQAYEQDFVGHVAESVARERIEMRERFAEVERLAAQTRIAGAGATAAALIALALIGRTLLRTLDREVGTLVAGAERLAAGALESRVPSLGDHELGRLAAAFNRMAASLEDAQRTKVRIEKLAAIGQLAASVGHDLRNPLGAIRNAVHYIDKRLQGTEIGADARVRQFLGVIDKEIASSTKIIGDLLDFARERRPARSACALRPLVADAISVVAPPRPVRIDNDVPDALPILDVDRDQLRQALVNLLQNAAEAAPPDREGHVWVSASADGDRVALSVSDDGEGISAEARAHLFEPLFTTKLKGTGLGLAIVEGVVRRHGGEITVESEPGAGTTFTIKLPLVAATRDSSG